MEIIYAQMIDIFQRLRIAIIYWAAKNPVTSLCCLIVLTGAALPVVSAVALMPIVFLFELSDYLAAKGVILVTYMILWQGLILGFLVVVLYSLVFFLTSSATVLHNYNFLNWDT